MIKLRKMEKREINSANYLTSIEGMRHPDRVMPEHDFLYILEGEWEIYEDEVCYKLQKDDLIILRAGRHHYGKKPCTPGNRHMYFHVLPLLGEQEETGGDFSVQEWYQGASVIHCGKNPQVRHYFQELIRAFWAKDAEHKNRVTLFFNLILCELEQMHELACAEYDKDQLVEAVEREVHMAPQKFYTSEEMAQKFFICPRTLNNRFRKIHDKTFYAWQMETKLEMVRQFLIYQPDAKLHETAVNFGFCDEFHLSKAFKKKFGMAPSSYVKACGIKNKADSITFLPHTEEEERRSL